MKTALICAVLLAPLAAHAAPDQRACYEQGSEFQAAAMYRDGGVPPENTLAAMTRNGTVKRESAKRIINLVYFDPRFSDAGGTALMQQVADACMHPEGRFKPLE